MRKTSTSVKLLASTALVAGAVSVAGLGTFGAFTSTTDSAQAVGSGTVELTSDKKGELSTKVSGLVPGDFVDRPLTLSNTGSETFGGVYFTAVATGDSVLYDAAAANSLRLSVDSCTTAWTPKAAGSAELVCAGGTSTPLVAAKPVATARVALAELTNQLNTTKTSHLRIRLALPYDAVRNDNALQGKTATVAYTFDATQRDGAAR